MFGNDIQAREARERELERYREKYRNEIEVGTLAQMNLAAFKRFEAIRNNPGYQQALRDQAERERQQQAEREARDEANRQFLEGRRDARLEDVKAGMSRNWISSGGDAEGFEKAWPELRDEHLRRVAIDGEDEARSNAHKQLRSVF